MVELIFEGPPGGFLPGLGPGIRPVVAVDGPNGPVIFAASGSSGGLIVMSVTPTGLQFLGQRIFEPAVQNAVDGRLVLLETPQGLVIVFGADGVDTLVGYRVTATGLGDLVTLTGLGLGAAPDSPGMTPIAQNMLGDLFTALPGALRGFELNSAGAITSSGSALDSATIALAKPTLVATTSLGPTQFVVTASREEVGITAFRVPEIGGPPVPTASIGTAEGLGLFNAPLGLEIVALAGRSFVVVASAPETGTGAALSVLELTENGALAVTDHILDAQGTRFGAVTGLSA
ncbi:MAG: hypothetical protein AAF686_03535, partial [Pseudomonadota bacterium]